MGKPSGGEPPNYAELMRLGYSLAKEYAEPYARQEFRLREKFDPKLIQQQQELQRRFGPTQYAQQLTALRTLDPRGYALREAWGAKLAQDLAAGGGTPEQRRAYALMGQQTTGELARGRSLGPAMTRETEQAIRAGQSARGNLYGAAPTSAEALYKGQRAQQLYQQRLQNASGFYNLQAPKEKGYAQLGGFLGSGGPRSPVDLIQGIQGVQSPRGFSYINPAAGQQAAQFGLANYPNQVANQGQNPWATALGAIGGITGAIGGSYIGIGPQAGAALGSQTGSALGGWIG